MCKTVIVAWDKDDPFTKAYVAKVELRIKEAMANSQSKFKLFKPRKTKKLLNRAKEK